jgi:hypothetical protein
LAGLLYLVLGALGEMKVRGTLVVSGDAAATAHNIMASEGGHAVPVHYAAAAGGETSFALWLLAARHE